MRAADGQLLGMGKFQSAPAGEGGRCAVQIAASGHVTLFQSAPAGEGGRCHVQPGYPWHLRVSIRARR